MLPHFTPVAFNPDLGLYFLRLAVGAVFLFHGWMKLVNVSAAAKGMGMKAGNVFVIGAIELLGALMLIIGYSVQLAAFLLAIILVGAVYYKISKWKVPFYSNKSTGYEFDLVMLASCLAILLTGGGSIGFVQGLIRMVNLGV
ncbi:DoxX family protein [Candidatus Uhrbacteria bacterium]|nr:DoxX family protein [Candidatus Uhrbacteria bacterium]